ncbi:MAG: alanyl-tRNA editing protein [Ruminococcaceae bacterium]|nr:alanyl-tRNA editing protein [Oscillospiraceae bacterium]
MTEKLYETMSHLATCKATVVSCERSGEGFDLILDKTVFFPEGGGQPSDVGTVNGERMSEATIRDGIVHHFVDREFTAGEEVECVVDMAVRFPRMQNHSGEHIVSGIIHRLYGFNNVGFHMGSKDVTLDIDGELSDEQIRNVERLANKAIAENVRVTVHYPDPDEANKIEYRSKLDISEGLRLVEIEGYDMCACCAPHVERTGEIGIIKLLEHIRYKGGTRIHMLCGFSALEDYHGKFRELSRISEMLSAKKEECADAVENLKTQLGDTEYKYRNIVKAALLAKAENAERTDGDLVFIVSGEFRDGLLELVRAAVPKCGGICAAFAGDDGDYSFIMGSNTVDLREKSAEIRSALKAKGGGSPDMIRGNSAATASEIHEYFNI